MDNVDTSVLSTSVSMIIQKRFTPDTNVAETITLNFKNEIRVNTIDSTLFTYNGFQSFFDDDGLGNINIYRYNEEKVKTNVVANAGTIDYDTGAIDIPALHIVALLGSAENIRVSATPHEGSKDISTDILVRTTAEQTSAVIPTAAKNIILALDKSASDVPNNIRPGISVTMVPRVAD
jgi:hypothetical protein